MRWGNRCLLRLRLLRDTALTKTWLGIEAQQVQQVGRLLLWRLLRHRPSAVFGRRRVRRRKVVGSEGAVAAMTEAVGDCHQKHPRR